MLVQAILIYLIIGCVVLYLSLHTIDEGHIAVYYRGGALLDSVSEPGFHFMVPLLTSYQPVQVTLQTDKVKNIPCGTSGGVMIYFDEIEVVNILDKSEAHNIVKEFTADYDKILIYDKVHHEVNQFCSVHTLEEVYIKLFDQIDENLKKYLQDSINELSPGLRIHSVRVTKPKIPESLRKNYDRIENEISQYLITKQREKIILKDAETDKKKSILYAQKDADVSKIQHSQMLEEKKAHHKMQLIENDIHGSKMRSEADAGYYSSSKEAESNKVLLSIEYMLLRFFDTIRNNSKLYFGPHIPYTLSFAGSGSDG